MQTELPAKQKYTGSKAFTPEQTKYLLQMFQEGPLEAPVYLTVTYGLRWDAKDIQAWLGHSDITTTLNVYGHVLNGNMDRLDQVIDRLLF